MEDVMNVAFLGLGGNTEQTLKTMQKAKELIEGECGTIKITSSLYETEAWGSNNLAGFLNQVIQVYTRFSAKELIEKLLEIEKKLGRVRVGDVYTDRVIDIDILLFNTDVIESETLVVPHPRMHLRKFVLVPFNEIAPNVRHPSTGLTMKDLLKECKDDLKVALYLGRKL